MKLPTSPRIVMISYARHGIFSKLWVIALRALWIWLLIFPAQKAGFYCKMPCHTLQIGYFDIGSHAGLRSPYGDDDSIISLIPQPSPHIIYYYSRHRTIFPDADLVQYAITQAPACFIGASSECAFFFDIFARQVFIMRSACHGHMRLSI